MTAGIIVNVFNAFNAMDEPSQALIIQLQIQDSQRLCEACEGKGKSREGELSDSQLAADLYREDLERYASILADRQMTRINARACQTDGNLLTTSLSQEQTAASDREIACRLGGVADPNSIPPWTVLSEEMDEELLAKLSALYVGVSAEEFDTDSAGTEAAADGEYGVPESSRWAAARQTARASSRRCAACQEHVRFFDTARVPCSHEYCRECLQDLFRASMTDDSLFPPRCCRQPITTGSVRVS